MRADGQMDMKLIVAFRNFADAPKNFYLFCFKFCLRIVGVDKGNFCSFLLGDVGFRLPLAATLPSKSCGAATDLSLFANNSCRKVTIYGLTPAHSSLLKHCTVVWRTVNERILAACKCSFAFHWLHDSSLEECKVFLTAWTWWFCTVFIRTCH
jgi:hypothetical protein